MARYWTGTDRAVWGSTAVPVTTGTYSICWWYRDVGGARVGAPSPGHFMNAVANICSIDPSATPSVRFFRDYSVTDADWSVTYANMGSPTIGAWNHYCWTHVDGAQPKFYLNGSSKTVTNGAAASGTVDTTTARLMELGNRADGARPLLGDMDCLGIYERELTIGEILMAMRRGYAANPKWLYLLLGDSPEPSFTSVNKTLTLTGTSVKAGSPHQSGLFAPDGWFERAAAGAPVDAPDLYVNASPHRW
jgi:hypothetical protein